MKTTKKDFKVRDEQGSQKKQSSQEQTKKGLLVKSVPAKKSVSYNELIRTPLIIKDNLLGGVSLKRQALKENQSKMKNEFGKCTPCDSTQKSTTIVDEEEELSALELYEDLQY